MLRQKKLEAMRIAELNQQKKQMEREIALKAAQAQAQGRGRRLSVEESSSSFSVSSQVKTEDVYSTIRKPKKDVQPKKEAQVSAHNSITP